MGRFQRLSLLLGQEVVEKLNKACVMVIGLGGVGSSCGLALARGAVGQLILIDGDIVEETNINRQALAFTSSLGQAKSKVMAKMVEEINPVCQVFERQIFLRADSLEEVLSSFPRPDYVIDCIDTVTQKLGIAEWAAKEKLPLLASMGAANKLDPSYLDFAYIEKTTNCSLSRVMRRECKKRGLKNLEVLYSKEVGLSFSDGRLGTISYMPPIMGQMLAGKVIRRLVGLEESPKTLVVD